MGGSGISGNVTATAEFNIYNDPDSAKIVVENARNLSIVPMECTEKTHFEISLFESYSTSENLFFVKLGELIKFLHDKFI